MRQIKHDGSLLLCLLLRLLLHLDGLIPSAVLLALHFWLDISVWWAIAAAILWLVLTILSAFVIGWAANCGKTPDQPKENKNPYSVRETNKQSKSNGI